MDVQVCRVARLEAALRSRTTAAVQQAGVTRRASAPGAGYSHFKVSIANYQGCAVRILVNGMLIGSYSSHYTVDVSPFLSRQDGNVILEDGVVQTELLNPFDDTVVVASPGDAINDGVLLNMNFFVDNVVGSVTG